MDTKARILFLKLTHFDQTHIFACDARFEISKVEGKVKEQLIGWIQKDKDGEKHKFIFERVGEQWAATYLKFPEPQVSIKRR